MQSGTWILRTRSLSLLLFSLLAIPLLTNGQQKRADQSERNQLIVAAREIIGAARYCALITLDFAGRPQARTMDPFPLGEDMVIWFGTNPRTRKVKEIRRNHIVAIYYFDPAAEAYVTIQGTARLVDDPREKARRWKDEWKAFYPDRGKSYILIAVTPERLEVVSEKKGITGDPKSWQPLSVVFSTGRSGH
jgi:general stress protein 26